MIHQISVLDLSRFCVTYHMADEVVCAPIFVLVSIKAGAEFNELRARF